jgi:hypothetical protein
MAVRGRSDRVPQTLLLEARAGVWRGFARGLLGAQKSFICGFPCIDVSEFWIPALSFSGGHCCQFIAPRAWRRAKSGGGVSEERCARNNLAP